jgi:hypothetical protein
VSTAEVDVRDQCGGSLAVMRCSPSNGDAYMWLAENLKRVDDDVAANGGVVLTGMGFISESEFYRAMRVLSSDRLDHVHAATRRHRSSALLASPEEPPPGSPVRPHNVNATAAQWPERVYLYCLVPAERGGETLVADTRAVHGKIDPGVRRRFEEAGVVYVRRFTSQRGQSWQQLFQTVERAKVERHCAAHGADFEWDAKGTPLVTRHRGAVTRRHPVTQEVVWFNHVHLLDSPSPGGEHPPSVEVLYGDGQAIEHDVLAHIRHAYDLETSAWPLRRGDVVVLDNLLVAVGRAPFAGHRRFVTATL